MVMVGVFRRLQARASMAPRPKEMWVQGQAELVVEGGQKITYITVMRRLRTLAEKEEASRLQGSK
jgi:hypothetical protein